MELAKPHAIQSNFDLITDTDHSPLTCVKYTSERDPVSQFVIDNLSTIDYRDPIY